MYARRYSPLQEEKGVIRIPENYAGNAFAEKEIEQEPPCDRATEPEERCAVCTEEKCKCKKDANALLPFFNGKFLSSDMLLLLLAFLLMGNGECDDLPGILIFIMLL